MFAEYGILFVRQLFSISAIRIWNLSVFGIWNPTSSAVLMEFRNVFFLHSVRDVAPTATGAQCVTFENSSVF